MQVCIVRASSLHHITCWQRCEHTSYYHFGQYIPSTGSEMHQSAGLRMQSRGLCIVAWFSASASYYQLRTTWGCGGVCCKTSTQQTCSKLTTAAYLSTKYLACMRAEFIPRFQDQEQGALPQHMQNSDSKMAWVWTQPFQSSVHATHLEFLANTA